MQGTVLLTGASGYIGSHVLDILMKQQYTVIATVRNDQQTDYFAEKYPNSNLGFVHVTDVTEENAFDFIMKYNHNITHVIHLACHKPIAVVDREKELFDPAVKANTNMIDAVFKYGRHVKSVVIASCFLAMMNNPPRFSDARKIYSARDVNPITREEARRGDDYSAMVGAKTFAEVAAWKNYTDLFCPKFALQSILFPMILGPPIHDFQLDDDFTITHESFRHVYGLINGRPIERFPLPFYIDVRDAALALVKAIQISPPQTNRWFIASNNISTQSFIDLTRRVVPEISSRLPIGVPGMGEEETKHQCGFDIADADEVLCIKYIELEHTIRDLYKVILDKEKEKEKEKKGLKIEISRDRRIL